MQNKRIVVKVGTSTLSHPSGLLNIRRVEELCKVLSDLKNAGNEIILVSSGAIGMGVGKLSLPKRPEDMPTKQAAAAVGQCELMYTYDKAFGEYNHTVAQILLTAEEVDQPDRFRNFHNTMVRLLELHALPIINENDTMATEEIKIGDNDTLAARVAVSMEADLLILLSDIDGLYTADPRTSGRRAYLGHPGPDRRDHRPGRGGRFLPGDRRHGHQASGRHPGHRRRVRHGHRQRGRPLNFV